MLKPIKIDLGHVFLGPEDDFWLEHAIEKAANDALNSAGMRVQQERSDVSKKLLITVEVVDS